jgi:cytosine permease
VAGLLCAWLLFYVPAMWGMRTGRPMIVVASSTFGARGATWVPFGLMALAQVVWFAVATYYATELTLRGWSPAACSIRGTSPRLARRPALKSPLFLVTSLFWSYAAALVGYYLVGVIAALMKVFPVFMALSLLLAALLSLGGHRGRSTAPSAWEAGSVDFGGLRAVAVMIQLVFGFFATAGAASADWGAVARDPATSGASVGGGGPGLLGRGDPRALTVAGAWGRSGRHVGGGRAWRPAGPQLSMGRGGRDRGGAPRASSCSSSAWRRWPPPATPHTGSATGFGTSGRDFRGSPGS